MRTNVAMATLGGLHVALAGWVVALTSVPPASRARAGEWFAGLVGLRHLAVLTDRVGMVSALLLGVLLLVCARRPRLWERPPRVAFLGLLAVTLTMITLHVAARRLDDRAYHDFGDNYHYVLGAKYFDELNYTDLYVCSATALHDLGRRVPERLRNLATNRIEWTKHVVDGDARAACRARFTPARWQAFKQDVRAFRNYHQFPSFAHRFGDHGYNGTPFWTVVSRAISDLVPANTRGYEMLAALNILLLGIGAVSLVYAFGWKLGLVAVLLLWVCYPDRFVQGGAHLRYLWVSTSMVIFALLKRERPIAAGALLGACAALLIFPGLVMLPAGAAIGWAVLRRRPLPRVHVRFVAAGSVAFAAAFTIGSWHADGLGNWGSFLDQMELNSGRLATGRIGFIYNFLVPKSWSVQAPDYLAQLADLRSPLVLGLGLDHLRLMLAAALTVGVFRVALHRNLLTATALGGFALLFLWFSTVRYYYAGMLGLPLMWHAEAGSRRASLFLAGLSLLHGACYLLDGVAAYPFVFNTVLVSGFTLAVIVAPVWLTAPRSQAANAPRPFGESAASGAYRPIPDPM